MNPKEITERLVTRVGELKFAPPVAFVYNPLDYAREPHELYLERFASTQKEVLLLGMNPGPFGMAQTGIPFGDVPSVRDWMGIAAHVGRPAKEHPARPVLGFACPRREVSGTRLWGWAASRFGSAATFFSRFYVANYCPLCFIEPTSRNRTPDKLPPREREPLVAACDEALRLQVAYFRPTYVVGVGAWAETCARRALAGMDMTIGRIPHPSPASPLSRNGWPEQVDAALAAMGIDVP